MPVFELFGLLRCAGGCSGAGSAFIAGCACVDVAVLRLRLHVLPVISDRENGGVIGILSYGDAGVRMEM